MKTKTLLSYLGPLCLLLSGCAGLAPATYRPPAPKAFRAPSRAIDPRSYEGVFVRIVNPSDKKRANQLEAQLVDRLKSHAKIFAVSQHETFSTRRVSILDALKFASTNQRIAAVLTVTPTAEAFDIKLTDVRTQGETYFGEITLAGVTPTELDSKSVAELITSKLISSKVIGPKPLRKEPLGGRILRD